MRDYLIVDGYNIIYAWPEFKKLKDNSLDHARAKLVEILINYAAISGLKVTVVFDAHMVKGSVERVEQADEVEIIYTQQGETADSVIERLVGNLANQGVVYVATSDWAEQKIIFGRGAYRLTPAELKDQVSRAGKAAEELYSQNTPAEDYLENRLLEKVRTELEKRRREKG